MPLSQAGSVYLGLVLAVAAIILWGGAFDLRYWASGEETISVWLRRCPAWFAIPASVNLLFLAAMILHLFAFSGE